MATATQARPAKGIERAERHSREIAKLRKVALIEGDGRVVLLAGGRMLTVFDSTPALVEQWERVAVPLDDRSRVELLLELCDFEIAEHTTAMKSKLAEINASMVDMIAAAKAGRVRDLPRGVEPELHCYRVLVPDGYAFLEAVSASQAIADAKEMLGLDPRVNCLAYEITRMEMDRATRVSKRWEAE